MTWLFGFLPHICRTPANDPEVQKILKKLQKFAFTLKYKLFVKDRKEKFMSHLVAVMLPALR